MGQIIVQTPAYLDLTHNNFIDEFQFITHHNIEAILLRGLYTGRTILASATPYITLLGCLK